MTRIINLIIFILILISLAFLAYFNSEIVEFDYFFAKSEFPLSILLLLAFISGVVVSTVTYSTIVFLQKRKITRLLASRNNH